MKVLLAGNGPKEQELRTQIRELGLDSIVRLLGYRTDLEQLVPAVNLVVSCSKREGLPLNIIEAMLCEKPIVGSCNRGHRELVRNEANGYLTQPEDTKAISEAIVFLCSDEMTSGKMGGNSLKIAKQYTMPFVKKELLTILLQE